MRIGGFGGAIMSKLGAVPQQIAGGEIYQALEKGTIDAAEWVGPYDDEKLGFYKVAKYYYYPGWWEGRAMLHFFFNLEKWKSLPKTYQAILRSGCGAPPTPSCMARYDMRQPAGAAPPGRRRADLKPFSERCWTAASRPRTRSMRNSPPRMPTSRKSMMQ